MIISGSSKYKDVCDNKDIINNKNPPKIEKEFLDALSEFICSVESEMDIIIPGSASLRFLSHYKIIDHIIAQKLSKNIIIKMLCPMNEESTRLVKQLAPFVGHKSIKLSLPRTSTGSSFFVRDKHDIFSFSIDIHKQKNDMENRENTNSNAAFSVNDWIYSKSVSLIRNAVYCFDLIWEEKENYDRIMKEKRHSDLLFDVISHDMGNYHQIIRGSLDNVTTLFKKNNNTSDLSQSNERIFSWLRMAENALNRSQSLLDNMRRLERLHTQKDLKPILKNLPDAINNAYSTVEQALYNNNPHGKSIRMSVNLEDGLQPADINITAEDLLEEFFINLFSNSVKYTDSSEVKIDVLIKDYFIGEAKYWMINISDYGKGIQDSTKKDLFERFYSKAKGSGLGLSIVRTLVERYKGKIWVGDRVYQDYTKGTTFGMIFPAAYNR
jgi:signal transduction histidine kinase